MTSNSNTSERKIKYLRITGAVLGVMAGLIAIWAAAGMDGSADTMMIFGLILSGIGLVFAAVACLMAANAVEEALGEIFERDETITMLNSEIEDLKHDLNRERNPLDYITVEELDWEMGRGKRA